MDDTMEKDGIRNAVVRICPACGVVNPSGPSRECPHLQLVRFDGIGEELEQLLNELAAARRTYGDLVGKLKEKVLAATRDGSALVETTSKVRSADLEKLSASSGSSGLELTNPKTKDAKPTAKPRKRRRRGPPPVDPRQLTLLAMSEPKGDA